MSGVIIWRLIRPFNGEYIERTSWIYNAPVLMDELIEKAKRTAPEGYYLHKIITPTQTLRFDKKGTSKAIPNYKI